MEAAMRADLVFADISRVKRKRFTAVALIEYGHAPRLAGTFAGISTDTVRYWTQRQHSGLNVQDAPRHGSPRKYDKNTEDRLIAFYCQTRPLPDSGRWSLRWAEGALYRNPEPVGAAPSRSTIQRILRRHNLRPHQIRYFLQITDPDFFPKMERLLALYHNPPKNLFCFDECPGIQILQRLTPELRPVDQNEIKQWWHEFEYIRNGTTDLFSFLEVGTGRMSVTCRSDHKKKTFLEQFRLHAESLPSDEQLHYVMDNLDSHCCYEFCELIAALSGINCPPSSELNSREKRREWLQDRDKRLVIHFTPFHGSWLNMAEISFHIIAEKCLKDSYQSPDAIRSAIYAFVREWNEHWAHPFNWQYDGAGLHAKAVRRFTAVLKHSISDMSLQYLTKSCKLMTNLLCQYSDKIDLSCWNELFMVLFQKKEELRARIEESEQPIVKRKARLALDELFQRIPFRSELTKVAEKAA